MNKTVAKIVAAFFVGLIPLLSLAPAASAQSELLFGQTHAYSVVMRGNGEAIVYAKIVVTNDEETPMTEVSFQVPGATPSEMAIYQMRLPMSCTSYGPTPMNGGVAPCLQYADPNYTNNYYDYYDNYGRLKGETEYEKVKPQVTGDLYKVTLPKPIGAHKSGAIVVAYSAVGYVKNFLGLYSFNFQTLKVPARINSMTVAVDVDSDLFMRGNQASVNYNRAVSSGSAGLSASDQSFSNREMNTKVSAIGSYGQLNKTAKNLSPNESFSVKGKYAKSWFRLNLFGMAMGVLVFVVIIVGIYFVSRFLQKRKKDHGETVATAEVSATAKRFGGLFHDWINLTNALVSFGSVALMILMVWIVPKLLRQINYAYDSVLPFVMFLAAALFFVLVILGPGIIIATKRGWRSFVAIILGQFLWLIVFFVVYVVFFLVQATNRMMY